ncbi:MAG TPA: hypothetical protein VMC09_09665 [Anaerolineales bacterium]|nr:hypothetical protein [Anaerolineales bacterium]
MGKYNKYQQKSKERPGMNPIWRGIGCLLIVIVPLLSYGLTALIIPPLLASGIVPYQILGRVQFPQWAYRTIVIRDFANFVSSLDNLWLWVIGIFVILVLLTGIFSILYSAIFQIIGPPRYTSQDAVPTRHKGREYKR